MLQTTLAAHLNLGRNLTNHPLKDTAGALLGKRIEAVGQHLAHNLRPTHRSGQLSNQIRLINLFDYPIRSYNAFIGFICGILSQDYDKEYFFLDSFLKLSHLEGQDISAAIDELASLSETYKVTFVLSVSMDESQLPENAKKYLIASL